MKKLQLLIISAFAVAAALLAPSPVALASDSVIGDACKNNNSVICRQSENAESKTNKFIQNIVNVLLFVLGIIAVIMIIVGGIRYTTSNGDQNQLTSAKNTILYAVVGLVIALLAYAIVNFVVGAF